MAPSRWADTEEDVAAEAARKRQKEDKKRKKAEYAQQAEEAAKRRKELGGATGQDANAQRDDGNVQEELASIARRDEPKISLLRPNAPTSNPCRSVENYEFLNHIEEGSYGWVSRAKAIATGEIVAIKKLKVESHNTHGFPVTAMREIECLMESQHRHIVELKEVVTGSALDQTYLVMEFLEHDLRTLQENMQDPFVPSEIKTIMWQLTSAVGYLHDHWILHRDLKTSNILMNNRGEIKIADFGMARSFGNPPPQMTQLVVTLWYRAPELLLGTNTYGQAVDIWSVGCVFGELLGKQPLLCGKNEVGQLSRIFELCGVPTPDQWPDFRQLPNAKTLRLPRPKHTIQEMVYNKFPFITGAGSLLFCSLLSLNPARRPSADDVLAHSYFTEDPKPKHPSMFPTFPSKAGQEKRRVIISPSAPKRGDAPKVGGDFSELFSSSENEQAGAGFQLKLG